MWMNESIENPLKDHEKFSSDTKQSEFQTKPIKSLNPMYWVQMHWINQLPPAPSIGHFSAHTICVREFIMQQMSVNINNVTSEFQSSRAVIP